MRRVPSRLLFAAFALSLTSFSPTGALAEPGFRHGSGAHFRASSGRSWGGHAGFKHWSSPRGFVHRGYAGRWPGFHRSWHHGHRLGFHGFGRPHGFFPSGYGRHTYARPVYGYGGYGGGFYGHGGYGGHVYGRHDRGRFGYGHHGNGHFYGRSGYGHHGYGRRGYGFFPHTSWVWPSDRSAETVIVAGPSLAAPDPVLVPSLADLPVSLGIRSAPVGSPAFYVVGSGQRSLRSGRAKVVSLKQGDAGASPRIIRLGASR